MIYVRIFYYKKRLLRLLLGCQLVAENKKFINIFIVFVVEHVKPVIILGGIKGKSNSCTHSRISD